MVPLPYGGSGFRGTSQGHGVQGQRPVDHAEIPPVGLDSIACPKRRVKAPAGVISQAAGGRVAWLLLPPLPALNFTSYMASGASNLFIFQDMRGRRDARGGPSCISKAKGRGLVRTTCADGQNGRPDENRHETTRIALFSLSSIETVNPTSPFGASSGLEALFPHFPHPQCPFGERITSPLPLSVVLSPRGPDLGGPPLAARSPSRSNPKIHYFFYRFLKPFRFHCGSQNDPQNLPKTSKNLSKNNCVQKKCEFLKNSTSPTPKAHL